VIRRDVRLLPVAGAAWAAALLSVFLPDTAGIVAVAAGIGASGLAAVTALAAVRAMRSPRLASSIAHAGLVVVMLATASAVSMAAALATPDRDRAALHDGRVIEVTADVSSSASVGQDGRLWFDAQTRSMEAGGEMHGMTVPVRVGIAPADGFDPGATIRLRGQVRATEAGERAVLVIFASEATIERAADGVFAVAAGIRRAFVERSRSLPEPGAGLLPGLAVGDTRAVSEALNADMRTSGLSHLTAVSGANCAIVVAAVFWLVALAGGGRSLRVALAGLALVCFVILVTPEPSVIRASVMAGVAMLTVLLGRPTAGAGMLALCAIGILLADPWLAATPGFALSVAASGALILLAPPLSRGLSRWMPSPVALAISVPLAAQVVCGPIIALFSEQQSLIGIAANLLAAPAAPIATVIGLLACLAAPVPPLADLLAASAWLPAAWIATTATVSAQLPLAQVSLVPGIGSAALVSVLGAAVAVVVSGRRRPSDPRRRSLALWAHRLASLLLVVASSLGAANLALSGPLAELSVPEGWSIAACDVGQGDALLVRSEGLVALIDTGPEPDPLRECLGSLGIDRIDLLVLTHFDLDHVGGVEAVQGRVDRVLHGPSAGPDDVRTLERLREGGATLQEAFAGQRGTLGDADWRVHWPLRQSVAFPEGNDASVVVEIEGGGVPRSIFLGDLSAEAQRGLMRAARLAGPFDVVKVAHHGSADQDPSLYETLAPAVALFSAGADNDYGHPRAETLDLLDALAAHGFRTDLQGRILLALRGDEVMVWTESDVGARQ
jgi:competence protein ComEC